MNFGQAIEATKSGLRVSRAGWNGRGMWLRYVPAKETAEPGDAVRRAYIEMCDAQGYLVPWLASQTDVLAEDWCTCTSYDGKAACSTCVVVATTVPPEMASIVIDPATVTCSTLSAPGGIGARL